MTVWEDGTNCRESADARSSPLSRSPRDLHLIIADLSWVARTLKGLGFRHLKLATGETIPIAATFAEAARSETGKDAATIGGAIGTAIAANTHGEGVQITAGTVIETRLTDQVVVPR